MGPIFAVIFGRQNTLQSLFIPWGAIWNNCLQQKGGQLYFQILQPQPQHPQESGALELVWREKMIDENWNLLNIQWRSNGKIFTTMSSYLKAKYIFKAEIIDAIGART